MEYFLQGFAMLMHPQYIGLMFLGVTFGVILGFLPGLTGSLGIALLLPFTFRMDAFSALVLLLSIYSGGLFGGSITAITINTPGSPPAIYTTLDGYPMFRKGEGGRALGAALGASVCGGIIGSIVLTVICRPMADFALRFGPGEMFMVMFFGISCVGTMSEQPLKSLYAGLFGVLLGTIGISTTGAARGTLGSIYLLDGLPTVPVLVGLVAVPSMINLINGNGPPPRIDKSAVGFRSVLRGIREVMLHPIQVGLCSLLGVIVGIVPAAGAPVASAVAYNQCKQFLRKGKDFGTGEVQGVLASESANNASEGGALATMFVLGIPGSNATAILLGALVIQGWAPGPKLFLDHQDVIYMAFSSLLLQQLVMLIVGLVICMLATYIIKIPNRYLVPCVILLTMVGAFSGRYLVFDIAIMIVCSMIGLLMKKYRFPVMPLILGLLLGGDADSNCIRITQAFDHFYEIFKSPIVLVLFIIAAFCLIFPLVRQLKRRGGKS